MSLEPWIELEIGQSSSPFTVQSPFF